MVFSFSYNDLISEDTKTGFSPIRFEKRAQGFQRSRVQVFVLLIIFARTIETVNPLFCHCPIGEKPLWGDNSR
jgi:hypothetical protein